MAVPRKKLAAFVAQGSRPVLQALPEPESPGTLDIFSVLMGESKEEDAYRVPTARMAEVEAARQEVEQIDAEVSSLLDDHTSWASRQYSEAGEKKMIVVGYEDPSEPDPNVVASRSALYINQRRRANRMRDIAERIGELMEKRKDILRKNPEVDLMPDQESRLHELEARGVLDIGIVRQWLTGPRGGHYYMTLSGKKVYG